MCHCAPAADFASAWSSGDDSRNLKEVEAFAKSLNVRREPAKGQLSLLAKARVLRAPKWPIACLRALVSAPDVFCRRQGEAFMFTSANVKQMDTGLMPQIQEANALMEEARAWFGGTAIELLPAVTQKLINNMDVRLVMHVHGFAKTSRPGSSTPPWRRSPAIS